MNALRSTAWRRWAVGAWTLALAAVCGSAAPVSVQSWKLVDGGYRTYLNTGKIVEFSDPHRYDLVELHRKRGHRLKQITLGN
jgi:hypothetical protein